MQRFNPKEFESKWQKYWDDNQTYKADLDSAKPKYISMSMFNYPSGAGIHIGHAMNYTISDVLARFKRQQGYESYHPVGWDSFGLPAENYAIKAGVSPQASMATIIPNYHKQYKAMGWSNDWSKEIATHTPEYYKWTQWIFSEMYRAGLAYQDARMQWWCDKCQTVLANEQVIDDKCWRHDGPDDPEVNQREVKQWFFKITDYADELLEATDALDWTEHVKLAQKNWIGKSVGAEVIFKLASNESRVARSYIMGTEDIKNDLQNLGIEVDSITDSGHFFVSFKAEDAEKYEKFIGEKLKPGFWNEYLLEDKAVFIFKDRQGTISRFDWNAKNENELLALCNKYADAKFESIRLMLEGNSWYQKYLGGQKITVFTTRPDTLFGATFLVLAPEHELVKQMTTEAQKSEVEKYVKESLKKSEVERQANKEKTGVFTGAYAVNPVNGEKIPVWIADYVLMGYGTGAIMAVPAHDDRDFEFAQKFNLPVRYVIAPVSGEKQGDEVEKDAVVVVLRNPKTNEVLLLDWGPRQDRWGGTLLIGGGIDKGEDVIEGAVREIIEESGYTHVKHIATTPFAFHNYYFSNVKNQNYYARVTGVLFDLVDETQQAQNLDEGEKNKFSLKWVDAKKAGSLLDDDGHLWVYQHLVEDVAFSGEGLMFNSGTYDGIASSEAREKIVSDLAKKGLAKEKVNFKMRDWSVSRQRYWGAPIPIVYCEDHGPVLVEDKDLPVVLPELDDFAPSGDGRSALARAKDWLTAPCPTCGKDGERETDTLDTYICSSWYMLRYFNHDNTKEAFNSDITNKWMAIDFYNGADHATAHMIYARFITRFFYKKGMLENPEPFKKFLFNGKVTAADGQMFSKSKGNGVDPLEIIEQGYGADALRTYLMFAAPLQLWAKWDPKGVPATHRFLSRVWTLVQEYLQVESGESKVESNPTLLRQVHGAIMKVTSDIEEQKYNTAIAELMRLTNELYKLKVDNLTQNEDWKFALESLVMMIAPFAPHTAEELWHQLGHQDSVHIDHWPQFDTDLAKDDEVTIAVQVNGKLRATIQMPAGADEETVVNAALSEENVHKFVDNKTVRKTIYVPSKLVNIVV
jgi:leucyl-tRNA synthetase